MLTRICSGASGSPGRRRDLVEDGLEERLERRRRVLERALGDALAADGVEQREVELRVGGVEIAEEVEDLLVHLLGARVGAVDLVDDDDDREAELEALAQDEARLGQGALGRVDEQERAVGHEERALDLAAEVGVAGRVDDVDLADGAVGCRQRTLVFFARIVMPRSRSRSFESITRSVSDLVGAERPRLAEHVVDERRLAVVDVGDDGDVAKAVGARDVLLIAAAPRA